MLFQHQWKTFHRLPAAIVLKWNVIIILSLIPLYIKHFPPLAAFKFFSLSLVFGSLTMMRQCGFFFEFILFGFSELLGYVSLCFPSDLGGLAIVYSNIFSSPVSLSSSLGKLNTRTLDTWHCATDSRGATHIPQSHLSLFFRLDHFYSSVFKFTNSFAMFNVVLSTLGKFKFQLLQFSVLEFYLVLFFF